MQVGRNEKCPCGSGKKYKRCCMNGKPFQQAELLDDIAQTVAMNPSLSLEELNLVAQRKASERNNRPSEDFCGLTPTQMTNWLYAPFSELNYVNITPPKDLLVSPVMRYLSLILDAAELENGSIKATAKGNLPAKLVKQASALLPEFPVAQYDTVPSIIEFSGINEDKFNALHYTHILAKISGILFPRGGRIYVNKKAREEYRSQGISVFFLPMLEAMVKEFNWGYFDGYPDDIDLRTFWVFMIWRFHVHDSFDQLVEEVTTAFPALIDQISIDHHYSQEEQLQAIIEIRFLERFMQYWGFVTIDPRKFVDGKRVPSRAKATPLLRQCFSFTVA